MADSIQWFFARAGQQGGPVDDAAFRAMAMRGEIATSDLVWRAGMAQWAPAANIEGLIPQRVPGQPPPIPSASAQGAIGYYAPPPVTDIGQDSKMRMLLPVGRSGLAIAAGYLGLFSVIPIFAPIALFVSVLAIRELRRKRHLHGMGRAVFGLVMGIVFSLVLLLFIGVMLTSKQ